ncbi:class D beta-lactamase [Inquilinus sp. Marseille-Q2685]|uniref:class D beta-lactamase n=1 Tax=Inquilinus sp. Marseille-Q2685 TaxID=2866581 RepID=UPI001CE41F41|nr:class D beta-lactamase [Inquilinus sp. Marseille-Q2685]
MKQVLFSLSAFLSLLTLPSWAETRTICTIVLTAETGEAVVDQGDCGRRMSPASTFKIAISLMAFDAGILTSPSRPELPFKEGYIDAWPEWRRPTTPATWMRDSVIWYSQQVTQRLGADRYSAYVTAFDYGNRDLAGDPGARNGLTHAWLSSSLQISPAEQVAFLRKLLRHELPVSDAAVENTATIMDQGVRPSGWHVFGKTGAGASRGADGEPARPFGWFVGWAERNGGTVVFARLIQDSERQPSPPGFRARDSLLDDLFSENGILSR